MCQIWLLQMYIIYVIKVNSLHLYLAVNITVHKYVCIVSDQLTRPAGILFSELAECGWLRSDEIPRPFLHSRRVYLY
jgi:hypothetical protein